MTPVVAGKRGRLARTGAYAVLAVLIGCVLAFGAGLAPASAHAVLLDTTPGEDEVLTEAPDVAEFRFNEPVRLIDGGIRLFPSDGEPLVLDAQVRDHTVVAQLPDALADGSYSLGYRVVSADGHPVGGAITFHIGEKSRSSPAPTADAGTPTSTESAVVGLTALGYLGLLVFAGLLFFHGTVLRSHEPARRSMRMALRTALGVAIGASALMIPGSALRVTGQAVGSIVNPSSWLPGLSWQPVVATAVTLIAGFAAYLLGVRARSMPHHIAASTLAAATVATPALIGHTQTIEPRWLTTTADVCHLLAGAFWIGGVIGLTWWLMAAANSRGTNADASPKHAVQMVGRFSRFALYSVILLTASGTVMALLIVDDLDALVQTGYGRTLLLKLGVIIPIVALAAWNRTRLLPRIVTRPSAALQWAGLRRILSYEAALLVAVIAITGFLSNSSPSHDHHETPNQANASREASVRAESQGLVVDGSLSPGSTGPNTLEFQLSYDGEAVPADQVRIATRLPEQDLGPFTAEPSHDPATGEYEAELTLPAVGEWHIEITARVSTYDQPVALIPIEIR